MYTVMIDRTLCLLKATLHHLTLFCGEFYIMLTDLITCLQCQFVTLYTYGPRTKQRCNVIKKNKTVYSNITPHCNSSIVQHPLTICMAFQISQFAEFSL